MSIAATISRNSYLGSGSTGPFAFNFRVFAATDLRVTKRSALGAETTLAYGTDWVVTTGVNIGDPTGSITLTVALANGETLTVRRAPSLLQPTSLANQGTYFGKTHEDEFDRLVMQIQSLDDRLSRAPVVTETYDPSALNLGIAPETGKLLGWVSGTQLGNFGVSTAGVALPSEGRTVATLTAWLLNNRVYNIRDYGAVADGSDSVAAIQSAIDHAYSNSGGVVYGPSGSYTINSTLALKAGVSLVGDIKGQLKHPVEDPTGPYKNGFQIKAGAAMTAMVTVHGNFTVENMNVVIANLILEGNALAVSGITLRRAADVRMYDVNVHNITTGSGFWIGNNADPLVGGTVPPCFVIYLERCYVNGSGATAKLFHIDKASQVHLTRCLTDGSAYSVYIENGGAEIVIDDCHFEGATTAGIWFTGFGFDLRVQDSTVIIEANNAHGIHIGDAQGVVQLLDNSVYGQSAWTGTKGIVTEGGAKQTIIAGNYLSALEAGIELASATPTWVSRNTIHVKNGFTALYVLVTVQKAHITDNEFDAPAGGGTAINNASLSKDIYWDNNRITAGVILGLYYPKIMYGKLAVDAGLLSNSPYGGMSSVTGSTAIYVAAASGSACLLVVSGDNGAGKRFQDLVAFFNGAIVVISSGTMQGAPDARTYSNGGAGALQLAMAAGTYAVAVSALEQLRT